MRLQKLLHGIEFSSRIPSEDFEISQLAYDSRKVGKNCLFVAIRGSESDGHDYIAQALQQGAQVILCEKIPEQLSNKKALFLEVENSRQALSQLSKNFYENPSENLKTIGITGTNGKTTLSYLIEALMVEAGLSPTVIGTINFRHAGKVFPSSHTTPESLDLDAFLFERKKEGSNALAMEVSSHAIDQYRVDGIEFDAAIFTNLTPDHLDYHKTLEKYFSAKSRLFLDLLPKSCKKEKFAILNWDDSFIRQLQAKLKVPALWFSLQDKAADIFASKPKISMKGIQTKVSTPLGEYHLDSSLLGAFNLSNLLAATGAGIALGLPLPRIEKALNSFKQVPGRLERVENNRNIHVFVDYAHTPDALKNVLESLREVLKEEHPSSQIITVFGCGGDRDKTKRPLMGREVARLSDESLLTSDNPRTEDPLSIIAEVKAGMLAAGAEENKNFWVEADRKKAIASALSKARAGDVVLIAGKGHEDYQILGKQKIHFDDREVAKECMS